MKKLILSFIVLFAASSFFQKAAAQEHPWMNYITPSGYFQTGFSTDDSFNNTFYIRRARFWSTAIIFFRVSGACCQPAK